MSAILLKQMVHSLAIPPVDAKTRGGEGSTLNYSYPLSILPFLFQFMHSVERDEVLLAVGGGNWVENPNVKKGHQSFAPKVACSHIQSRFILPVGRSQLEHLMMKWLEPWLSRDTGSCLCQELCHEITYLIVTFHSNHMHTTCNHMRSHRSGWDSPLCKQNCQVHTCVAADD